MHQIVQFIHELISNIPQAEHDLFWLALFVIFIYKLYRFVRQSLRKRPVKTVWRRVPISFIVEAALGGGRRWEQTATMILM